MAREATVKSRTAAYAGIFCVVMAYIIAGWFSPPIPLISLAPLFGIAIVFMFLAKTIREREGSELRIPAPIRTKIMALFNMEAALGLLCGVSTMAVLGTIYLGEPKTIQQVAILASLSCFIIGAIGNFVISRRYHGLLAMFDADLGSSSLNT